MNEQLRPFSKEFYDANPVSKEMRLVCVAILNRMQRICMLSAAGDNSQSAQIYSELELLEGQLITLNIKPGMETGRPKTDYQQDAVLAMQYTLGQIYELYKSDLPVAPKNFKDHGEVKTYEFNAQNTSDAVREFAITLNMLSFIKRYVDYQEEDVGL